MRIILALAFTTLLAFVALAPIEWCDRVICSRIVGWLLAGGMVVSSLILVVSVWLWAFA